VQFSRGPIHSNSKYISSKAFRVDQVQQYERLEMKNHIIVYCENIAEICSSDNSRELSRESSTRHSIGESIMHLHLAQRTEHEFGAEIVANLNADLGGWPAHAH